MAFKLVNRAYLNSNKNLYKFGTIPLSTQNQGSTQQGSLNIVQQMPSYQRALQYAVEHQYQESLGKLKETMNEISQQMGNHTVYHLFLLQRIASLYGILNNTKEIENTYQQCIETSEKMYPKKLEGISKKFMWYNNLLKFYLDQDIDKACDYGEDLINDIEEILPEKDKVDLKFTLATAYTLKGSQLDEAANFYKECLELTQDNEMKGFIYNNLGISNFYNFVEKSINVTDIKKGGLDVIGEIMKHFEQGISDLKNSIQHFENFKERFSSLDTTQSEQSTDEVTVGQIKQKLFVDEFFDPNECRDVLPKNFKQYDLKHNAYNEKFLSDLFTKPQSILPIQNLGEMAYIIQKYKESFSLMDISLKLYKTKDPHNLLQYKVLSLIGSLLDSQNDVQSMQKINDTIFKRLENTECYEKVFALRNYGFLLARRDETRLEGKDYIEQAEKLAINYPFWSERKMNLFVPVMGVDESQLN